MGIEQRLWKGLPKELRDVSKMTIDYSQHLSTINSFLKDIYGKRANWDVCIDNYNNSKTYNNGYRIVKNCKDIPTLSQHKIREMLDEEKKYNEQVKELLELQKIITFSTDDVEKKRAINRASELLGLLPTKDDNANYQWIINKSHMSQKELRLLNDKIQDNENIMKIIITHLIDFYLDGFKSSFPYNVSIIMQPRSKYYFRGENAYYGSSKPSIFRKKNDNLNPKLSKIVNRLILNEGCSFFDDFDAIKYWNESSVNNVALAQHYGLHTPMMDITSDLMTALFFACCKYGDDGKWHPLTKSEIEKENSRINISKMGGDSRYGIIYRMPTEIEMMRWATASDNQAQGKIIPVGYQPFMRCSSQHAYMLLEDDVTYDMLQDKMFEKFKFRLTEEFCNWVFTEMDQGNKVYPKNDIADISLYMNKINNSHVFSKEAFIMTMQEFNILPKNCQCIINELYYNGYYIIDESKNIITNEELKKINENYTIQKAIKLSKITVTIRPTLVIVGENVGELKGFNEVKEF